MMQSFMTWWTIQAADLFSWMAVIVMAIPVAIVAGYLGRISQRFYWNLNEPYSERIKYLNKK